jgi:hypothetical protein
MKENPVSVQEQLVKIREAEAAAKVVKAHKLSQKSVGVAVVLTLLIPLIGYAYTGRWAAFFKLLGCAFVIGFFLGLAGGTGDSAFTLGTIIGGVCGAIDQALAINKAKETLASYT